MKELIDSKIKELKINIPNNSEFLAWINQSDMWNGLYSLLCIKGEPYKRTVVVNMLSGKIIEEIPLSKYTFAQSFANVCNDIKAYVQMQSSLEVKMLFRWGKMLLGLDESSDDAELLRHNRSAVYEWELIPPEPDTIKAELLKIVRAYNSSRTSESDFCRMAKLHLDLNRLYAFGENTTLISMAALIFSLMEQSYPVPELPLDDVQYNTLIAEYVESNDSKPFEEMLMRSVYNRLDKIVMLARQANEKE